MIDLGDEKQSLGVISVTRVTETSRRRRYILPMDPTSAQLRWPGFGPGRDMTQPACGPVLVKKK
jgi:hypothetical protein